MNLKSKIKQIKRPRIIKAHNAELMRGPAFISINVIFIFINYIKPINDNTDAITTMRQII